MFCYFKILYLYERTLSSMGLVTIIIAVKARKTMSSFNEAGKTSL